MSNTKKDAINPVHYRSSCSLECIEVMRVAYGKRAVFDFCICNAFKYAWRFKNKNGREDLNKAQWYVDYVYNDVEERANRDEIDYEALKRAENLQELLNSKRPKGEENE